MESRKHRHGRPGAPLLLRPRTGAGRRTCVQRTCVQLARRRASMSRQAMRHELPSRGAAKEAMHCARASARAPPMPARAGGGRRPQRRRRRGRQSSVELLRR
jgi:hypothetical protein